VDLMETLRKNRFGTPPLIFLPYFIEVAVIGTQFGRLVVIAQAATRGRNSQWLCLCDCGNRSTGDDVYF